MPSKANKRSRQNRVNGHDRWKLTVDDDLANQTCSFEKITSLIETLEFGKETSSTAGKLKNETFAKARRWRRHWFVASILSLREGFCNFGFQLVPAEMAEAGSASSARQKLKEWMADPKTAPEREQIHDYVQSLWMEWLLLDNVISFWRKTGDRPVLLNLEECEYKDEFGSEVLRIKHNLRNEQIDKLQGWSEAEKQRLREKNVLEITPDDDLFFFKVSKWMKVGCGLGWPSFMGVFEALGQGESLEVGDAILAYAGRTVWEQHKIGHEIKAGVMAGNDKFRYDKKHADAFIKATKGRTGHTRVTTPWDHEMTFPRVDPKQYDATKFQSVIDRLMWWSQPLGRMIAARGITPYLMGLLGMQVCREREKIGRHLTVVLNEAFELPVPVKPRWSTRCFKDERLAMEMIKTGVSGGPISQETFIEEAGHDAEVERERKLAEDKFPKAVTTPAYDANHGPAELPGRPPGSPDPTT